MTPGGARSSFTIVCLIQICALASGQAMKPIYQPIYQFEQSGQSERYAVWPDRVTEGSYSSHAISSTEIESDYPIGDVGASTKHVWKLHEDISQYPQATSDYPMLDALYNLSLEEMKRNIRSDGAFSAGAKWEGVWTRDISYSILLSLAIVEPAVARESLMRKVKDNRIVQDTGTGGSWPVSSDRVCWALAAWEIYLVTGDRAWLNQSFSIVRDSIQDDEKVVIDPVTGLAHGESSFMDWREQTYPRWMEPADIYASQNLGTNAVYYRVYRILSMMSGELGQPDSDWDTKAERIRLAINAKLWMPDRHIYGEYLYGRISQSLSPRSDALGQSLSILFDVADPDRQDLILKSQPLMPYGIPTVYPQTPNIPPYHNRSVWPFVQAFWNLAAAKRGNQEAVLFGLASITRSSALFLTNKENFVADTGSPIGTQINSDRQLWSVAGNLAMTYRVLFGIHFTSKGLELRPVIPQTLQGTRTLANFHYRGALLSIVVKGFGSEINTVTLDGKPSSAHISPDLTGSHTLIVEMSNQRRPAQRMRLVQNLVAPETPAIAGNAGTLSWRPIEGAVAYQIYRDGIQVQSSPDTSYTPNAADKALSEYQVAAIDKDGVASFLSAPWTTPHAPLVYPADPSSTDPANVGADSYVTIDQTGNTGVTINGAVPLAARYHIAFRYANGSGPLNTDNKCAIRTLFIDGKAVGPIVLPQRGTEQWQDWGFSNGLEVQLAAGSHHFELRYLPHDRNMNKEVNRARIASIVLTRLGR